MVTEALPTQPYAGAGDTDAVGAPNREGIK